MVATELALGGTQVMVVDALPERSLQSKAMSLQPRTAEVFDLRGLFTRASTHTIGHMMDGHFATIPLSYAGLDTRYPYQIGLLQWHLEDVLQERLAELGGDLRRGWTADRPANRTPTGSPQSGRTVRCGRPILWRRMEVGARSANSWVTHSPARMPHSSPPSPMSSSGLAPRSRRPRGRPDEEGAFGQGRRVKPDGSFASVVSIGEEGLFRFVYFDGQTERTDVTNDEVTEAFRRFYGDEYDLLGIRFASRFSDATRQVEKYRHNRVFLAGDAAHIHPPAGGQGLNLGVQDAFNLGWKLAAVLRGAAPESLLDTYQTERHATGKSVLDNTLAQAALGGRDPQHLALRDTFAELLRIPEANRTLAGMISGLGIDYGGEGRDGTRLPDFDTGDGWASELFHAGKGVLVSTGRKHLDTAEPWADRIHRKKVTALPWPDTEAALVRPDGYICWTPSAHPLTTALTTWFGEQE